MVTIPAYRLGFTVNVGLGEFCVRTRKRYYQTAFAVEVHLYGYRCCPIPGGVRNRWAFIQFGDKTWWLRKY
jgi:hypothetical protein